MTRTGGRCGAIRPMPTPVMRLRTPGEQLSLRGDAAGGGVVDVLEMCVMGLAQR